jgi:hypothetical protein
MGVPSLAADGRAVDLTRWQAGCMPVLVKAVETLGDSFDQVRASERRRRHAPLAPM